ncbi:hypothetical protein AVEN_199777-1 [Araneus ventricosus]|uniref:Uncharacterized protein n=1 Tax=Araneus ventricosus TaxID=182803 RepID=A0A4Y2GBK7_ARAVE|nr:hypothetical protein AVEN_199777-1 [Araneus ventricosus]
MSTIHCSDKFEINSYVLQRLAPVLSVVQSVKADELEGATKHRLSLELIFSPRMAVIAAAIWILLTICSQKPHVDSNPSAAPYDLRSRSPSSSKPNNKIEIKQSVYKFYNPDKMMQDCSSKTFS